MTRRTLHDNSEYTTMRLVYWLLGFLGTAVVGLGGFITEHALSESTSFAVRLAALESQNAVMAVTISHSLESVHRLEDKVDKLLMLRENEDALDSREKRR